MLSGMEHVVLECPSTLQDALTLLARGDFRPFAGGTDLMVEGGAGRLAGQKFVSVWALPELSALEEEAECIWIGAAVPYSLVVSNSGLNEQFPNLVSAARQTGARAIQNRGTLGGNVGNASPAADSSPALLCYDAQVELVSLHGRRLIPYKEFHTGYKTSVRRADELISRFRLPLGRREAHHYYRKVGTRRALAISKVSLAAVASRVDGSYHGVRMALGSLAPTVIRLPELEQLIEGASVVTDALIGKVREEALRQLHPIDDIRSTAKYRAHVAANLIAEFLEGLK